MRAATLVLLLTSAAAAQTLVPAAPQDVQITLPNRAPLPQGSHIRVAISLPPQPEPGPRAASPPADILHGAPPPKGGLLQGSEDPNPDLLNPPPP